MEKFRYKAKDNQGKTIEGLVEAADQKGAVKILQSKGLLVISIAPKGKDLVTEARAGIFGRISTSDKVNFTRQLATMVAAGLPLTEALTILETQASPAMARVVGEILREVEGGGSLSKALEKHPRVFDQVYIALVRAGESAGILDNVLTRLAENLEKQREFTSKVKGAMLYPAIVIGGMILVATIMILFVIPKLTSIYEEFQAELPLPTKILLQVSKFATHFWWLGVAGLIGLVFVLLQLLKNPILKKQYDQLFFRIPIIGNLRRQFMFTEFTRTLGLLVGAGILIVDALEIVRHSLGSPLYEEAVSQAGENVQRGFPLGVALAETEVFPSILPQMISVGEETGKLDEVLGKVSSYFSQEAEQSVKNLTAALEPLIMIVLGVGVGFLIIAIIMPIYSLTSQF
jgi:type IV pilus assembly protein PilC